MDQILFWTVQLWFSLAYSAYWREYYNVTLTGISWQVREHLIKTSDSSNKAPLQCGSRLFELQKIRDCHNGGGRARLDCPSSYPLVGLSVSCFGWTTPTFTHHLCTLQGTCIVLTVHSKSMSLLFSQPGQLSGEGTLLFRYLYFGIHLIPMWACKFTTA